MEIPEQDYNVLLQYTISKEFVKKHCIFKYKIQHNPNTVFLKQSQQKTFLRYAMFNPAIKYNFEVLKIKNRSTFLSCNKFASVLFCERHYDREGKLLSDFIGNCFFLRDKSAVYISAKSKQDSQRYLKRLQEIFGYSFSIIEFEGFDNIDLFEFVQNQNHPDSKITSISLEEPVIPKILNRYMQYYFNLIDSIEELYQLSYLIKKNVRAYA